MTYNVKKKGGKMTDNVIRSLNQLLDIDIIKKNDFIKEDFQGIIHRLEDSTFKLVVVGEFSSGKSTFLNAFMGKDILKHGVKETTATITEIYNLVDSKQEETFDVYYEDGKIQRNIPLEQLIEYTSTASTKYQVASEIDRVEIRSHLLNEQKNVCLIDTPGLNGIADKHREKTIHQIKNAHACIYLIQVRGLGKSDLEFIKMISEYQHNIIFVQNFIDELKELEGETVEQKLEKQREILKEKVFGDKKNANYQVVGMSARKALIARDIGIKEYEHKMLDEKMRATLLQESCFESILNAVSEIIKKNERENLQKLEAVELAYEKLKVMLQWLENEKKQEYEDWQNRSEGLEYQNYQNIEKTLIKNKEKWEDEIKTYIKEQAKLIKNQVNKRNEEQIIDTLMEIIIKKLQEINSSKEMNDYMQGFPGKLYDRIIKIVKESEQFLEQNFELILYNSVLKTIYYVGGSTAINKNKLIEFIKTEKIEVQYPEYKSKWNFGEEKEKIVQEKMLLFDTQEKKDEATKAIKECQDKKQNYCLQKKNKQKEKENEIENLGDRPSEENKVRIETYEVDRKGLGKILDWIWEKKKCEREVPYIDYKKQKEWDEKKREIEEKYRDKMDEIEPKIRDYQRRIDEFREEIEVMTEKTEWHKRKIEYMEESLKEKKEYYRKAEAFAKKEYLRGLRQVIENEVKIYLEEVLETVDKEFQDVIHSNKTRVTIVALKYFEKTLKKELDRVSGRMDRGKSSADESELVKNIEQINKTITVLEEYKRWNTRMQK